MSGLLTREHVVNKLRRLDWRGLSVEWAVVFGGLTRRGVGSDVDLLVKPVGRGTLDWRIKLVAAVGNALGVDWALVDIVEAKPTTPCPIVFDAWMHGVTVYEAWKGAAREWLFTRVKICSDELIVFKRLKILETAVEAIKRRWDHGGSG